MRHHVRVLCVLAFTSIIAGCQDAGSPVEPRPDAPRFQPDGGAGRIPFFQFAVFFEHDLEMAPGQHQEYKGWVHSNGDMYIASEGAKKFPDGPKEKGLGFWDQVTTAKKYINDEKAYEDQTWNTYFKNNAGDWVRLTFDSNTFPRAEDFRAASNSAFDGRLRTEAFNVPALRVLAQGIEPVELLQPRRAGDGELLKANKFAWRADWYITVPLSHASLRVPEALPPSGGTTACEAILPSSQRSGQDLPLAGDCNDMFKWTWDKFFDARELRYVDVLDIDIDRLSDWGRNHPNDNTQVLYVTFAVPEGTPPPGTDPKDDGLFPVVRLVNGKEIKSGKGLTIATDRPLFVKGDYNSNPGQWVPAAIVADAVSVLSNSWDDAKPKCTGYQKGQPTLKEPGAATCPGGYNLNELQASATTIHAAVLAGHDATPCYHAAPGCNGHPNPQWDPRKDGSYYKGGGSSSLIAVQGEDWKKNLLAYKGSLVSLHHGLPAGNGRGLYSKGKWAQAFNTAPTRVIEFDERFLDPANLPPATPSCGPIY
jgi:hypothetical protein